MSRGSGEDGGSPGSTRLSTTSYAVLGLVNELGEATPYDVKMMADTSIGYFWDFPRSQIYAEAARLVDAGLLAEEREEAGRRRRLLRLTDSGQRVLADWVGTPVDEQSEIRDMGLLKLFFSRVVDADAVVELAHHQLSVHRRRLHEYGQIADRIGADAATDPTRTVLEAGLRFEQMITDFWEQVSKSPPGK